MYQLPEVHFSKRFNANIPAGTDIGPETFDGLVIFLLFHLLFAYTPDPDPVIIRQVKYTNIEVKDIPDFTPYPQIGVIAAFIRQQWIYPQGGINYPDVIEVDGPVILRNIGVGFKVLRRSITQAQPKQNQ